MMCFKASSAITAPPPPPCLVELRQGEPVAVRQSPPDGRMDNMDALVLSELFCSDKAFWKLRATHMTLDAALFFFFTGRRETFQPGFLLTSFYLTHYSSFPPLTWWDCCVAWAWAAAQVGLCFWGHYHAEWTLDSGNWKWVTGAVDILAGLLGKIKGSVQPNDKSHVFLHLLLVLSSCADSLGLICISKKMYFLKVV